eukprot:TRINITY_DN124834_c0_g1_i1.p1 TRINITY_DN124834_c0_g1~~TRINITY_DN124834_c0_g1_i1.p1  ORF type:complete len:312 (-),score=0.62 TRINITY_DN124834_c0_g1_i1:88-1023(-)
MLSLPTSQDVLCFLCILVFRSEPKLVSIRMCRGCRKSEHLDNDAPFATTYEQDFCGMSSWAPHGVEPLSDGGVYDNSGGGPPPWSLHKMRYQMEMASWQCQKESGPPLPGTWTAAPARKVVRQRPSSAGPCVRRRRSSGPSAAPGSLAGFRVTSFSPFETRDTPRGKFSHFPSGVTRSVPRPKDPLGFTPYGPSTATGVGMLSGNAVPRADASGGYAALGGDMPWAEQPSSARRHHLDAQVREHDRCGPRGRACRFPGGGYIVGGPPLISHISHTQGDAGDGDLYMQLEHHPRGRGNRYPHELDPYPSFRK